MTTPPDKLWIRGHEAGNHNTRWNTPAPSRMTPVEGLTFLATCICDIERDTVEWARHWIADHF